MIRLHRPGGPDCRRNDTIRVARPHAKADRHARRTDSVQRRHRQENSKYLYDNSLY